MNIKDILICPVCRRPLHREGNSYFCDGEKRHCYDISSAGHTNLCPGRATGGDDKGLVRARTQFLNLGHYERISELICRIIGERSSDQFVVDAGCGEGYYTNNIAASTGASVLGFDLSKEAVISASKSAKRKNIDNSAFFVGGIYDLPVADGSADVITSIFAPCSESEFSRILKDGGLLILVASGKDHLYDLKAAVYDSVHTNEERADLPKSLKYYGKHTMTYTIELNDSQSIRDLFSMTPYYYRTSERDMQKLLALESLTTTVEADIYIYRKEVQK